jgi:hypothetical protein
MITGMASSPAERISMIRESATLLDKQDWTDIDLVLGQFGLPVSEFGTESKTAYVINMIKSAGDDDLHRLHTYLVGEASGAPAAGRGPWNGEKLRLFCSHLAKHKAAVGQVGEQLSRFGIEPFVAHDSIEPSKEWAQVIEHALADCDAMIVFLHPGFRDSTWCDQEVGWALGRRRPILPLNYGTHPYGFLGKFQDQPCGDSYPVQVANYVMDWLTKTPSLHGRLAHGLVDAFVNSGSWNFTRQVAPLLERMPSITDDDLTRMEKAARDNVDVRECGVTPQLNGPEWVTQFVSRRRGTTAPATWSSENVPT